MARKHAVDADKQRITGGKAVGRRSFLTLAGTAATTLTMAKTASTASGTDDGRDMTVLEIDYDQYELPSDVYRVWTCDEEQATFTREHAYTGKQALKISLEGGGSCGTNTHFNLEEELGYQPREIYDSFMIRLPDDWTMAPDDQCKISRAALSYSNGDGHSGGGVPNGSNGWSAGLVIANRGSAPEGEYNLASYVYHVDASGDNSGPWETTTVTPGQWHHVEQYLKVNTTDGNGGANNDGVYRVWVDGDLGFERTDYRWTTKYDDNAIEYCGPYIRYGGGETAPQDMAVHYDDHTIAAGNGLELGALR